MSQISDPKEVESKLVLIGDKNVGKTCIALRFVHGEFSEGTTNTIGASFLTKRIISGEKILRMQIWDTAGEEKFKSMLPMYYRGAGVGVLIYDICSESSFESVKYWVKELRENAKDGDYVLVIAGNKCDLENERQVATKKASEFAQDIGALYFETSARSGQGCEEMFEGIANAILKKKPVSKTIEESTRIQITEAPTMKRKKCCLAK